MVDGATQQLVEMKILLKLTQDAEAAASDPGPETAIAAQQLAASLITQPFGQAVPQTLFASPTPEVSQAVTEHVAPDAKSIRKRSHSVVSANSEATHPAAAPNRRMKAMAINDLSAEEESEERAETKRIEVMLKDGREATVTGEYFLLHASSQH